MCAVELLFYRQLLELLGFPQGPAEMTALSLSQLILGCWSLMTMTSPSDAPGAHTANKAPAIFSDSTTAPANAAKPMGWLTDKFKHIKIHYHFFQQYAQKEWLNLRKVLPRPTQAITLRPTQAITLTKGYDSADAFENALSMYTVELPTRFRK